jgi:hypothetical protein
MNQFRTKAQKAASKLKQIRSEQEMRYVSERLQGYDEQLPPNTPRDYVARAAFEQSVIKEARIIRDLSGKRA